MKFDEVPFVPCNDCTTYESCTQEAYEQGKADAKAEHDKECDRCLYSLRKETTEEVRESAREKAIDDCKNIVKKFIGYLDEDMIGRINLKLEQLKRCKE